MAEQTVPSQVQTLLQILVGNDWPEGNPSDLRSMATAWRTTATDLGTLDSTVRTASGYVDKGIVGETQVAFHAYAGQLTRDGDGYLPTLAAICGALGDALDNMALQTETLRIEIIGMLVALAVEIAIDIALSFITFGASDALIPVQMAVTRVLIMTLIRRAVIAFAMHMADSLLQQVGWNLVAQLDEMRRGYRKSLDTQELTNAALSGAVGGAVGFGMGGLGALFGKGLTNGAKNLFGDKFPSKLFDGSPPSGLWDGTKKFGANAPFNAGWGAAAGAAEASAQDKAMGGSGDTIAGAENGAFNGIKGGAHSVLNPHGKFSISPISYLHNWADKHVGGPDGTTTPAPTPPTTSTDGSQPTQHGATPSPGLSTTVGQHGADTAPVSPPPGAVGQPGGASSSVNPPVSMPGTATQHGATPSPGLPTMVGQHGDNTPPASPPPAQPSTTTSQQAASPVETPPSTPRPTTSSAQVPSVKAPDGPGVTTSSDGPVSTPNSGATRTVTSSDGSKMTTFLDGTTKTTLSDGTQQVTKPDGSQQFIMPDGKTRVTTSRDGTQLTWLPDGTRIVTDVDGSQLITRPDGSRTVVMPDGTRVTTSSEGTQVSTNPTMADVIVKALNPGSSGRP